MNLPNKLTLLRVGLIPFFVIFLLLEPEFGQAMSYIALVIFVVASVTDYLDGQIARKRGLVTNFGKFMDPLADKLLVTSALICLIELDRIPAWIVLIIIAREFIISGFRLVAVEAGVVIAASYWGKLKTVVQMLLIIVLLINFTEGIGYIIEQILLYASLILTIISLGDYMLKNKEVIFKGGK